MQQRYQMLGELLVESGILTNLQLMAALAAQESTHRRLGEIVVERGYTTEDQIVSFLAEQYGLRVAEEFQLEPSPEAIDLIDADFAYASGVLPLRVNEDALECVVSDPVDINLTDAITQRTGKRVRLLLSTASKIEAAVRRAYGLASDSRSVDASEFPGLEPRFCNLELGWHCGHNSVLHCWDEKFGRRVSLIAVPANSPAREEQFELVRTAAERSVPGVAAVHDWVSTPSFDYFVLDKLEGEPLDRILAKLGPRDVAQTARIAIQVAEAIEFLTFGSRSSGIITPQNVVVKADGTASLAPLALPSYAVFGTSRAGVSMDLYELGHFMKDCLAGQVNAPQPTGSYTLPAMQDVIDRCIGVRTEEPFASPLQVARRLRSFSWAPKPFANAPDLGTLQQADKTALLGSVETLPAKKRSWLEALFGRKAA